jgi:hypothetical protein
MASEERQIERWNKLCEQPNIKYITCYVCKYTAEPRGFRRFDAEDMFHAGNLVRYGCPKCQLIFGDLRFLTLSREEISRDYEDVYSYTGEGDTTNIVFEMLKTCNLYDPSLTYLDFACGNWNKVIPIMQQEGFKIKGYDKYVGKYKEKPTELFDIVYSCNYIEHVISPFEDIAEMLQFVKPGGKLVLMSSDFEYCIPQTHYHTFFFSDKSLKIICEQLHMKMEHSERFMFPWEGINILKVFRKE